MNHSSKGTETVTAINNLALLTGNVGRAGAAPFSITGQCNAMGTREAGFTSGLPGYRKFESVTDREELAALWRITPNVFPRSEGLLIRTSSTRSEEEDSCAVDHRDQSAGFVSESSMCSSKHCELEFLVVQDCFHPTPTTELAQLVLPAASGEKKRELTPTRSAA